MRGGRSSSEERTESASVDKGRNGCGRRRHVQDQEKDGGENESDGKKILISRYQLAVDAAHNAVQWLRHLEMMMPGLQLGIRCLGQRLGLIRHRRPRRLIRSNQHAIILVESEIGGRAR